ncbi:MAG: hypothetical protein AAGN82_03230 [Myxococcota bacterium]
MRTKTETKGAASRGRRRGTPRAAGLAGVVTTALVLVGATATCRDEGARDGAAASASATATNPSARTVRTATAPPIDRDWCREYLAALARCVASPPPDGSSASFAAQRDTTKKAYDAAGPVARAQMQSGCQTGLLTLKQRQPPCGDEAP